MLILYYMYIYTYLFIMLNVKVACWSKPLPSSTENQFVIDELCDLEKYAKVTDAGHGVSTCKDTPMSEIASL